MNNNLLKVDVTPIREKAYLILKQAIINGQLKPGQVASEKYLADSLGISRTPLREAIRKLEVDGFIRSVHNKHLYITDLSLEHAQNLWDVRSRLEGLMANSAAKYIKHDQIVEMEKTLEESALYIEDDFDKFVECGRVFHKLIHSVSLNNICMEMLNILNDHIGRYIKLSTWNSSRATKAFNEHMEVIKYIKQKSPEKAEAAMMKHIIRAGSDVLKAFSNNELLVKERVN